MPSSDRLIPVIDISRLAAGDPAGEREVARLIGEACRGIGFFYITGHGVARDTLQSVFNAAADFFQGPAQRKEKLALAARAAIGDLSSWATRCSIPASLPTSRRPSTSDSSLRRTIPI